MVAVLAGLFAGTTAALTGLLLVLRRDRARLEEAERRSRLGAEHARLHLSVLARAGDEMSGALESYDEALTRLVGVVVPSFADWFAVDLVDEAGRMHRVASGDSEGLSAVGAAHRHPQGDLLVKRVIESGQDEVVALGPPGAVTHEGALVTRHAGTPTSAAPGVESMVIVPVEVRGLAFGALSFVTGSGRRGYRLSDLETAHGLAQRVAVAIERVLLWRESRRGEEAATSTADQLRRLTEAALAVNAPLAETEILGVLADHTRRVLGAERAWVCTVPANGDTGLMAAVCSPVADDRDLPTAAALACDLVLEFDRPLRAVVEDPAHAAARDRTGRPAVRVEGLQEGARVDPGRLSVSTKPWLAVPLPGPLGGLRRVIVVEGTRDGVPGPAGQEEADFGAQAESVLMLLAQMASVALVNADLYQEVRSSERRLRAVVESSPLAIAELDMDGRGRWWNRAAEPFLGISHASAVSGVMPVSDESEQEWSAMIERSKRALATVGADVRVTGSGDRPVELSVSSAPLLDNDGQVSGILIVAEDVTERRRVLEQMHQTERLAAMARLAGGVAHDFNNLLAVILGSSELLARRTDADESLLEEVDAIRRAGQRAAALTAQLLMIGRSRSATPALIDPDVELASMTPMLERALGDDVHLELLPGAGGTRVLVGSADFERAVLNLAINARDAMNEGGSFVVSTRVLDPGSQPPGGAPSGRKLVVIAATDSGEGMDEKTAERCFEPYFSTKEEGQGTGLGLFAVQAVVTQAGGHVTVDTSPGRGSTFTMWFPAADDGASIGSS